MNQHMNGPSSEPLSWEVCPHCGCETGVYTHGVTNCKRCGMYIVTCSLCPHDFAAAVDTHPCRDCYLEKIANKLNGEEKKEVEENKLCRCGRGNYSTYHVRFTLEITDENQDIFREIEEDVCTIDMCPKCVGTYFQKLQGSIFSSEGLMDIFDNALEAAEGVSDGK